MELHYGVVLNNGTFPQLYVYLRQTKIYFGSKPAGLSSIFMEVLTEGERLPNSIPQPVEQNWAENLETNCQRAKHRKEQTITIALIILWPEKL